MVGKKWRCPYAVADKNLKFLMCKKVIDKIYDGKTPKDVLMAAKAICTFQKYCSCSGKMENTDSAKKCYENQSERA